MSLPALVALSPVSGPGVGGGHVMRCLALASALQAKGARCVFATGPQGSAMLGRFGPSFEAVETDDAGRLQALAALNPDAVVIDDYSLDAAFEIALAAPVVMAIDDLADRPHRAALLLDPGYGRTQDDYRPWVAADTRLLLGPAYALLRPAFAGRAPRLQPETLQRLFVSFGLSDVEGVTGRVVATLARLAPQMRIDVAVGAGAQSLPTLQALAAREPRVSLHIEADTAPLMRMADAAIGAGGAMTWERRALGLPSLAVIVADNQRPMIQRLAADGVILAVDLADTAFDAAFTEAFARLNDPAVRRAMIANPRAACDGQGAPRAAEALMQAIKLSRG